MKVRYKKTGTEAEASNFNMHAMAEVLTGDDSPFISELDVFIEATNSWMDMNTAFREHYLITDNYNSYFFEPKNDEDKQRGYTL